MRFSENVYENVPQTELQYFQKALHIRSQESALKSTTVQDRAGCTTAQYTMFQHHATDYALYVCNENTQKM